MNTAKIYHDIEGNEKTIHQMVKAEPHWAANRIQAGENARERVRILEGAIACFCREELGDLNFETDQEAVGYILGFLDT